MLSPAGEVVQGFALRRPAFRGQNTRPEKRRAGKAHWGAPRISGGAPQTPVAEGKKNLLSLKAANSHLWWTGVALVVFMIVWWLDRLPVISCSNSAHKGPY